LSKARVIPDAERTARMLDLLHRCYPGNGVSLAHVVIEQVAPTTGWARRWADALVLAVWPSKGLTLDGYEVKASRADLRRELRDLDKHRALARYCDAWWLLAWDESVLLDEIPPTWGIILTEEDDDGERTLVTKRKAAKLKPEPWPREFICSLVRNAYVQSPGAAYVARAVREAHRLSEGHERSVAAAEARRHIEPLARLLYGDNRYKWPDEASDPETVCRLAAERLAQLPLAVA